MKEDRIEEFLDLIEKDAVGSRGEEGCLRFGEFFSGVLCGASVRLFVLESSQGICAQSRFREEEREREIGGRARGTKFCGERAPVAHRSSHREAEERRK